MEKEKDQVKIEREAAHLIFVFLILLSEKSIAAWVNNRFNEGIHFHKNKICYKNEGEDFYWS